MLIQTSTDDERSSAQSFFDDFPRARGLFKSTWIQHLLSPTVPRRNLPPFFWFLVDREHAGIIGHALELLGDAAALRRVIRELQAEDEDQIHALVRELEIYRILKTHNQDVEWKPALPGPLLKRPDLAVIISGRKIYVEVFTMRESKPDREERERHTRLRAGINEIRDNPYGIVHSVVGQFTQSDVEPCVEWIRASVGGLGLDKGSERTVNWPPGGKPKLRLKFIRTTNGAGGCWATMQGVRVVSESRRVKNRLLDKLDAFQFPVGPSEGKGYVVVLDALFLDFEEVLSAILGRPAVRIQLTDAGPTSSLIREVDGVVHDPERGKLLVGEIDFIATYNVRGRAVKGRPEFILNGGPGKLTGEEVERMFTGGVASP